MDGKPINFFEMRKSYNQAGSRLIILDYDGTLVPREKYPDFRQPSADVIKLLHDLTIDPANRVVVISGRNIKSLDESLLNLPITLAAEHGALYKESTGDNWLRSFDKSVAWISVALTALRGLVFHYPGSEIEEKEHSVSWHFRNAKEPVTPGDIRQILSALRSLSVGAEFAIREYDFFIELRTPGVSKGAFISRWVGRRSFDFIMAVGDGYTNEDLFELFGDDAFTIKVNKSERSAAKYYINNQQSVIPSIEAIVKFNDTVQKDMGILYNQ